MKKIFTLLCAAIVAVTMTAATYNGNCGANAKWSLDTSTGVLTVSGSGAMLYVPAESVELYKAADQWKEFDIEAINEEQGVEKVLGDQVPSTKVLRNGMLLIERNGKTYTMQGQQIQ